MCSAYSGRAAGYVVRLHDPCNIRSSEPPDSALDAFVEFLRVMRGGCNVTRLARERVPKARCHLRDLLMHVKGMLIRVAACVMLGYSGRVRVALDNMQRSRWLEAKGCSSE